MEGVEVVLAWLFLFALRGVSVAAALQPSGGLALAGARIYTAPAEQPVMDGVVVVEGGKIVAVGPRRATTIPPGVRVLDVAGHTVTAGFWNSHVHFTEMKWAGAATVPASELTEQLQEMLTRFGFVHVFDTGSPLENTGAIRRRIDAGEVLGPSIHTTGMILFPQGGTPPVDLIRALGFMPVERSEIATAGEALAALARTLDGGADGIKLYAMTWFGRPVAMPAEVLEAATREARRRGKLVFAHPTNTTGLSRAVAAGVDVIVHTTPESGPWSVDLIADMKAKRVALIPTLKLWRWETRRGRRSLAQPWIEAGVAQLRAYSAAGGTILFGTDVGYMDDYDPAVEYEMMSRAGLGFAQILASLTTAPAERFGVASQTGRIAPGLDADLVVLERDPSADVRGFAAVRYAFRKGVIVYGPR